MRRAAAGVVFLAIVASTSLWIPRHAVHAKGEPVTWARDLDGAVKRAAENGKALAILFR